MSLETRAASDPIPALLKQAAAWRLLARLFECPDSDWAADIRRLASEVDDEEICGAATMVDDAATEGQYHSIFGPGGPAPPREASYRESLELGSLMSEIAVYYDAFGYTTAGAEPPDHIAVEAGFIAYLTLKQAYALACEDPEHAELAAIGASRFRADHLAYIAAPMAALLAGSNVQYLARAARALATRVGLPPRSSRLPMAQPAGSDEDPLTCS